MVSRRDQFDAFLFARRRVVAAFLQADPVGTEEAAPRPLKNFLGSIGLAVAILAGVAFYAAITSSPTNWKAGGQIVVSKETGARYVYGMDNKLHPVLNTASARLLSNPGKGGVAQVVVVKQKAIDQSDLGSPVGILSAPETIPSRDALANTGWIACSQPTRNGRSQTSLFVGERPRPNVLKSNEALIVRNADDSAHRTWLLANGRRFEFDSGKLAVIFDTSQVQEVSGAWLATIPEDRSLRDLGVPADLGQPLGEHSQLPKQFTTVGQLGKVLGQSSYLIATKQGGLPIRPIVAKLLLTDPQIAELAYRKQNRQPEFIQLAAEEFTKAQTENPAVRHTEKWPTGDPPVLLNAGPNARSKQALCVTFESMDKDGRASFLLSAGPEIPDMRNQRPQDRGSAALAVADLVNVASSRGALVREQLPDNSAESIFLVTQPGYRYRITNNKFEIPNPVVDGVEGQNSGTSVLDAVQRLGFEHSHVTLIPKAWLDLLEKGPALDSKSAGVNIGPGAGQQAPQSGQ